MCLGVMYLFDLKVLRIEYLVFWFLIYFYEILFCRWEVGLWIDCLKSCNDGMCGVRLCEVFCVEDF